MRAILGNGTSVGKPMVPLVVVLAFLLSSTPVHAGRYELVRTYGQGTIYRTSDVESLPPQSISYDSDIDPNEP